MRSPTFGELRRFCEVEGWIDLAKQAGRKRRHHFRFALVLTDGRTLYTRVSMGSGSIDDPGMFKHILRDQMEVTAAEFWAAVDDGVAPHRPGAGESQRLPGIYLDHGLVKALLRVGCPAADIAALTKAEAVDLLDHLRG